MMMDFNHILYCKQNKMNSSELLKSLNAQNHNKHAKKKEIESIPEEYDVYSSGGNEFEQMELPMPPADAPHYFTQLLREQEQSQVVNQFISAQIEKVKKQREKNAYLIFNDGPLMYLKELKNLSKSKNPTGAKAITDFMGKRYNNVASDLQNGKIIIDRERTISNRDQLESLNELDVARMIKIKDGAIRSKLDLMNLKMEEIEKIDEPKKPKDSIKEINKKLQENLDLLSYNLKSEKTKIAHDYVKHMTEQRKQMKKREELREQRRRKIEEERSAEMKEADEMKDQEKRDEILKRIDEKKKKREKEEREMAEKEAKIEKFLAIYKQKMPIYKKKRKEYEDKFVKPEKVFYEERLKEIKEKKKSYSLNDIVTHQKKYQQIRQKQNLRKSQQKEMIKKEIKVSKQYYRGSVHSYVEELDRERKEKNIALYQLGKHRKERMWEYSKEVGENHKPKVDEEKRNELLRALEFERMKKNGLQKKYRQKIDSDGEDIGLQSYYEEVKPKNRYIEGNKFLEYAKMKKKKGYQSMEYETERTEQQNQSMSNIRSLKKSEPQTKEQKEATQRQIWELRAKHMEQMSSHLNSPKQFQQIKVSFENFDKKASDKESLLKHARMSIEDHIAQKGALDQFYLESIKQKMKLLD